MSRYPSNLTYYRKNKSCFGGHIYAGNPKSKRPFFSNQALHVVLRSSHAKGHNSMLRDRHCNAIKYLVRKQALRFRIELYRYANSGNHLHLLVKPGRNRKQFTSFIRAISGLIVRQVLRAERGQAKGIKFWDARPFTRVVSWGKAFERCALYIEKNILEALGFEGLNDDLDEFHWWREASLAFRA